MKTLKTLYSLPQRYNLSQAPRPSLEALVELNFHISVFPRICPSAMFCRHTGSKKLKIKRMRMCRELQMCTFRLIKAR